VFIKQTKEITVDDFLTHIFHTNESNGKKTTQEHEI
jgi:hypothetical protein